MDKGLQKALHAGGGARGLGPKVGLTSQAIYLWKRIPAERVIDVERATGVPREELRPDLYLAPRPRKRAV